MPVEINHYLVEPECSLYGPDNTFLGIIDSGIILNDVRLQIKKQKLVGIPQDFTITLSNRELEAFAGYTTAYADLIKQAVVDAINALKIGQDVLITKLYVPANLPGTTPGTTFDIISIKIAKVGNAFGTSNVNIIFNEAASCELINVTVVVP